MSSTSSIISRIVHAFSIDSGHTSELLWREFVLNSEAADESRLNIIELLVAHHEAFFLSNAKPATLLSQPRSFSRPDRRPG